MVCFLYREFYVEVVAVKPENVTIEESFEMAIIILG